MKAIQCEAAYQAALAQINLLIDTEPGTQAFVRLEAISRLVDAYENKYMPWSTLSRSKRSKR